MMTWETILSEDDFRLYRENISLLEEQVISRFPDGYKAPEILTAIRNVPRHLFVRKEYRYLAYTDNAFPTFHGLTTSAPSVIAEMIYLSGIRRGGHLLEIGTGTGYQASVLLEMGADVCTIEIDSAVAASAERILSRLGYKSGRLKLFNRNGAPGLPEHAPFDAIIVSAAVQNLKDISRLRGQLKNRGRLLFLFGSRNSQKLHIVERNKNDFSVSVLEGVTFSFVPLVSPEM